MFLIYLMVSIEINTNKINANILMREYSCVECFLLVFISLFVLHKICLGVCVSDEENESVNMFSLNLINKRILEKNL